MSSASGTLAALQEENEQLHAQVLDLERQAAEAKERQQAAGSGKDPAPCDGALVFATDITARRRAEGALRDSEENLRALIEALPDLIVRFDLDGRHLFASENFKQAVGMPAASFIGKTPRELGLPESVCCLLGDGFRKVIDGSAPHETEFAFEGTQGRRIYNCRFVPERDAEGTVRSVLGVSRDVTVQRRVEREYQTLFEEMLEGFALHEIILDGDGRPVDYRFLAVNPAFEHITGLKAEALVGKTVLEAIPDLERRWIEIYGRVALTGEPVLFEDYARQLDKHFAVTAFRPAPNQFACIFSDISEHKRAEEELRASRALLNSVVEGTPDVIYVKDLEGRYLHFNAAAEQATGKRCQDVLGKDDTFLLPPHEAEVVMQGDGAVMESGKVATYEETVTTASGEVVTYLSTKGPLFDSSGAVTGLFGIARDITAGKQRAVEREIMLDVLRLVNQSNEVHELVRDVTQLLQKWSGCEAVGIRLQEGDDYPYFETRGFPAQFVEAENLLCARDLDQQPLCDAQGNPVLECMCGNVLSGRFDPRLPFFTENGSFWTNSTTALLASTTEADRQARTRNRCHGEGYESVALIPLRTGNCAFGLLQLNDRRKSRFTPEMIALLERASSSLAIAFQQRRTQESLRVSRERYRLVADYTYDWEFWLAPDGTPLYHSPSCERITGYRVAEFMADPELLDRILHPDDRDAFRSHFQKPELREPYSLEFRIRTKPGDEVVIEHVCRPVHGEDGTYLGHRGSNRDITERQRVERQVREADRRFLEILEAVDLLAVILDTRGNITFVNEHLLKALGWERAEILGRNWFDTCLSPEARDRVKSLFQAGIAGGEFPVHNSNPLLTRDGRERLFLFDNSVLRDHAGRITGSASIARDITDQDALEQQLRQAQKMESIGRLAGGIAHDFNNLLTVINGYSSLMLGRLDTRDPWWQSLNEIRKAGERAADLTKQLLAFSRKQVVEPKAIDLNRLVSENRDMLKRLIGEDVEFVTTLDPALGHVVADTGQFHQVLMNLVVNARDAMPTGGRLLIATENLEVTGESAAARTGAAPGNYASLIVADTGVGMSEEVRQHLFEPFFTTKGEGQGTGLGLATVYGIVRQHGGWVYVESEPGRGATFRIGLPVMESAACADLLCPPAPVSLQGTETLLVVEDQDEVRDFCTAILRSYGYRVLEAGNAGEALLLAESNTGPIDLLLTDMVMPGLTGIELAKRLRRLRPGLRVLFMSGYSRDLLAQRAEPGATLHHVAKPFSPEELGAQVRVALGVPGARSRVLVVDDDVAVRNLFSGVLAGAGYEVLSVADGSEALRVVEGQTFDLIISDLAMPNREGIETIREILRRQPGSKIIAISGAYRELLPVAKALGAQRTLAKPVNPEQLLAAVRAVLSA